MQDGVRADLRIDVGTAAPFRLDLTAWALRRRPSNSVDVWDGTYRRALVVDGRPLALIVEQLPDLDGRSTLGVTVAGLDRTDDVDTTGIERRVRALLGLDADLTGFYEVARRDPRVDRLADRFRGVRPPRFPDLFEAFVNAIANQQLSLESGIAALNRFADAFGRRAADGSVAFPIPGDVVGASPDELRDLGFSYRKAEYVLGIAERLETGRPGTLDDLDRPELTSTLMQQRGIGRWSAEYVMLRGLGRIDVFPGDDVGARNNLQRFMGLSTAPNYETIAELLEPWAPWAGMIYFHLLLDRLAERGVVQP